MLATFQAIVLTWHEYAMSTLVFRWILNYIDSLIPFLFSATLFGIIESINSKDIYPWFYFLSGYAAVGLIAYVNQYFKSKKESVNKVVLYIVKEYHPVCIVAAIAFTLIFSLFGWLSNLNANSLIVQVRLCLAVNVFFIVYTIWVTSVGRKSLKSILREISLGDLSGVTTLTRSGLNN